MRVSDPEALVRGNMSVVWRKCCESWDSNSESTDLILGCFKSLLVLCNFGRCVLDQQAFMHFKVKIKTSITSKKRETSRYLIFWGKLGWYWGLEKDIPALRSYSRMQNLNFSVRKNSKSLSLPCRPKFYFRKVISWSISSGIEFVVLSFKIGLCRLHVTLLISCLELQNRCVMTCTAHLIESTSTTTNTASMYR